jgi:hypothetical protein
MHLGVDPNDVERSVHNAKDDTDLDIKLINLFPKDVRASVWNRELVQKGMTAEGQKFLLEALTAMGCADRADQIRSVPDLIDFDEGRID